MTIRSRTTNILFILSLILLIVALGVMTAPTAKAQEPGNIWGYPVRCRIGIDGVAGGNCIELYNGTDISLYSGAGSGRTVLIDGATGNITTAGTITATSIVSQTTGLAVTGNTTLLTTTVGSANVGTFTVHAPAVFTGTITSSGTNTWSGSNTFSGATTISGAATNTGSTQLMTTTIGSAGVGSLTVHAPVVLTSTLSLNGDTFTGPMKYGKAATYTSGTSITHGFATTPTMCILSPIEITATLTITATGFSSNTATHANPAYWMCGQ